MKEKKRRKLPIIIIAVIVVIALVGILSDSEDEPSVVAPTAPPTAQTGESAIPSPTPVPPSESPQATTFGVGEQVELNNVIVTLTEVTQNNGSQFNTPTDGYVYVICHFLIENNSAKDLSVSSILSFEAYVDDFSTGTSLGASISTDAESIGGDLAAGKKMQGAICYELPEDWRELEITFSPSFWSKGITFVATSD